MNRLESHPMSDPVAGRLDESDRRRPLTERRSRGFVCRSLLLCSMGRVCRSAAAHRPVFVSHRCRSSGPVVGRTSPSRASRRRPARGRAGTSVMGSGLELPAHPRETTRWDSSPSSPTSVTDVPPIAGIPLRRGDHRQRRRVEYRPHTPSGSVAPEQQHSASNVGDIAQHVATGR